MLKTLYRSTFKSSMNGIFYKDKIKSCKSIDGYYWEREYTPLGQWFEDMPMIFNILKLFYYIPYFVVNTIGIFLWIFIQLFIPGKILKDIRGF